LKRFVDGGWYAATVASIQIDPTTNETVYTLVFDHDGEVEQHGIVSLKKVVQQSLLKELTMQQALGLPAYDPQSDGQGHADVLGGDMIAFMASKTQKRAAENVDEEFKSNDGDRENKEGKISMCI
jgi:hypothetical protein